MIIIIIIMIIMIITIPIVPITLIKEANKWQDVLSMNMVMNHVHALNHP